MSARAPSRAGSCTDCSPEGPMGFAEACARSNFSFLEGASHPDEMVAQAKALGLSAIGIADRNTLAGAVRAFSAGRAEGVRVLTGSRLVLRDGTCLLAYPRTRPAYGRLCRLLTLGNRRAPKGACHLDLADVLEAGEDTAFILMPPEDLADASFEAAARALAERFPRALRLGAVLGHQGTERRRLRALAEMGAGLGARLLPTTDPLYHTPARRPLADVVHAIRLGRPVEACGLVLAANTERHLKSPAEMTRLCASAGFPDAPAETGALLAEISFSLDELSYQYPSEGGAPGESPQETLERLAREGFAWRFPQGVTPKIEAMLAHELAVIGQLGYAPYFLTVHEIVSFARSRGILAQGRGSAANSVVCYVLGLTAVDPTRVDLLFERFISPERGEPPDIDIDFEHERREEVIQYIYARYGRHRAGLAATVITYRARSAVREVGKALGLSLDMVGALARTVWGWSAEGIPESRLAELGLDAADPRLAACLGLTAELIGFPRHLSQHVGGFVLTEGPLEEVVPIGNAAMPDRTFVEWDKDDLDRLGILKIDVLALGMLTCIAKAFALLETRYRRPLGLAEVPPEDPRVYDMLCRADSVGVFQVESRAQMSMLPRLRPRNFYDLVIEVAIVRPGPIQGDMVHPYLRRRAGAEPVSYPSEELRAVLDKTLGVPLFQEQAMRIAIVAAGFTPAEADRLRRAMATFRKTGLIHEFRHKLIEGMVANGYERDFAERCFRQIEGFGEYGFPESHAASFALLVYVSAWLKCHYPDVFACAILNSQPMGFYAPAQLVRDAREHGTQVRPPDVNASEWDCTLEPLGEVGRGAQERGNAFALRLGFRQIKGLREPEARALAGARGEGYESLSDLWRRAGVSRACLARLAEADAFRSLGLDRRQALWAVEALAEETPLFAGLDDQAPTEDCEKLPRLTLPEHVVEDYTFLRLSLKAHPLAFLRPAYGAEGILAAADLARRPGGTRVSHGGLVLVRQRPGTASGVIFATLEDETGIANIIVWPKVFEAHRRIVLGARLIVVHGRLQREGLVTHIIAERLEDRTADLATLSQGAGALESALEAAMARADEVRRPNEDPREITLARETARAARTKAIRDTRTEGAGIGHPRTEAIRPWPRSRDFH
ncbi:MAG: error-prone DNA polymerase [Alphaproteobacteria bacterium]|nr:error-prone DNA polymerase [Alphaproteobacteria bacterium]